MVGRRPGGREPFTAQHVQQAEENENSQWSEEGSSCRRVTQAAGGNSKEPLKEGELRPAPTVVAR